MTDGLSIHSIVATHGGARETVGRLLVPVTVPAGFAQETPFKGDMCQVLYVRWQAGPVREAGVNGVQVDDVLDVCLQQLRGFQGPPDTACNLASINAKTAEAIWAVEQALAKLEECRQQERLSSVKPAVRSRSSEASPVDRSKRVLADGSPVTGDYRELRPDGQQKGYVVLSADERAKGFVRPVRRSYTHKLCGADTTMGLAIAETYARDPGFYRDLLCHVRESFPVDRVCVEGHDGASGVMIPCRCPRPPATPDLHKPPCPVAPDRTKKSSQQARALLAEHNGLLAAEVLRLRQEARELIADSELNAATVGRQAVEIARLQALVEKMREHIERAGHSDECAITEHNFHSGHKPYRQVPACTCILATLDVERARSQI